MLRCSATRAMTRTLHEPWPRPKRPPDSPGSAESIRRAPRKPQSQSAGNRINHSLDARIGMMPSEPMHKVVIHKAGGYEQLKIETHPTPKPGAREVLIRTQAVGVNYADICVRW